MEARDNQCYFPNQIYKLVLFLIKIEKITKYKMKQTDHVHIVYESQTLHI